MAKPDNSGLKLIERLRSDSERQLNFRAVEDDPDTDDYAGVGSMLRHAREQHGLDLFSVASALRIQVSHLDAIESGDFQRLPGATYAVGFLRSYADYLGLDAGTVVQRFKEETEIAPAQTKLVFPEPVEETRRPGLRTAFVTVLMAAGLYGGWVYLERHGQTPIEAVSEPPQRFSSLINEAETAKSEPKTTAPLPVPSAAGGSTIGSAIAAPNQAGSDAGPSADRADSRPQALANADGNAPLTANESTTSVVSNVLAGAVDTVSEVDQRRADGQSASERSATETAPASIDAAVSASVETADAAAESISVAGAGVVSEGASQRPAQTPAPRQQQLADVMGVSVAEPVRVQVTPAESDEAIASADAVAEQGNPQDDASPTEQAAAAEVAIDRHPSAALDRTTEARAPTSEATDSEATNLEAGDRGTVVPSVKPTINVAALQEDPDGLAGASTRHGAMTSDREEEATAPAIPQIQSRVASPPPPAIPAAPPPAPRLETASLERSGSNEGEAAAPRYRPQVYGVSTDSARVIVRATADSWVQVQGANNELLLTRILRAGDTYYAPNRNDLVLMTGNAGAIEVMVDGKVLGTLGPVGAVRRNIGLHADALRSFVRESGTALR